MSSAICFNLDHSKIFSSANGLNYITLHIARIYLSLPFIKWQIFDFSKLKKFAGNNFRINENGRKLSKQAENTVGKGEIACYQQFLLFPQCFQKTCTTDT